MRIHPTHRAQLLGDAPMPEVNELREALKLSARAVLLAQVYLFTAYQSASSELAMRRLVEECWRTTDVGFEPAKRRADLAVLMALSCGVRPHRTRCYTRDRRAKMLES